ncbi:MAG: hypothetical protein ACYST5_11245 [Planctomycetota bacterium]
MNVNLYNTTDYEEKSDWTLGENEPNSKSGKRRKIVSSSQIINRMKQRIDSDLSAAIKKSCRRTVVDTCFCNDQAWCIGMDGSIADCEVLHICTATLARSIITCVKRNGFDNFTGNSFSHFTTPMKNILADSGSEIKENLTGQSYGPWLFMLRAIPFVIQLYYRTKGKFIMANYRIRG